MVLLDFVSPTGSWYARHPMTSAALGTILSFWIAGLLLEGWVREREARRLDRISSVAYRSLAQHANDAGRTLLACLNGADVHTLGLPGATRESVAETRSLLDRNGITPSFDEISGSWRPRDPNSLKGSLLVLLRDEDFVAQLYRAVAAARRRVQDATATWAPVMLTAPALADDLGRYRDLADALELLQERLRPRVRVVRECDPPAPSQVWLQHATDAFWQAIGQYESVRDEFGNRASLPSDDLIGTRRPKLPVDNVAEASPRS